WPPEKGLRSGATISSRRPYRSMMRRRDIVSVAVPIESPITAPAKPPRLRSRSTASVIEAPSLDYRPAVKHVLIIFTTEVEDRLGDSTQECGRAGTIDTTGRGSGESERTRT